MEYEVVHTGTKVSEKLAVFIFRVMFLDYLEDRSRKLLRNIRICTAFIPEKWEFNIYIVQLHFRAKDLSYTLSSAVQKKNG